MSIDGKKGDIFISDVGIFEHNGERWIDRKFEIAKLREQIKLIREAAIRYGVNDEVAAVIAHADLVAGRLR